MFFFQLSNRSVWAPLFVALNFLALTVSSERIIISTAVEECQNGSNFTVSLFNVFFTPDNNSVSLNVNGDSYISGKVKLHVQAAAYGYEILNEVLDPCTLNISSFCPMQVIPISFDVTYNDISQSVIDSLPSIAYGVPDLDAKVTVRMVSTNDSSISIGCASSVLSNGKTVHQTGVGWATAVVAGIGLVMSALISGLGHSNAASHIAVYASSLFSYFQAVAIIGLCATPLPPMTQAWTLDFSWSMGIIRVQFLQTLASWYQSATGGTPANILKTLGTKSVQVMKRSNDETTVSSDGEYSVSGIKRVAFEANIEPTSLFMTGLIFFCIFVIFTVLGVVAFKYFCELAIRKQWMRSHRFENLRRDFQVVLKGIIFRILLIGYPQMTILCLWEFTQIDSPGEAALAVFVFFGMSAAIFYAVFLIVKVARHSERTHKTAAYLLYGDASILNKWGFFYIQYRASAYYYIVISMAFIFVKGVVVALGQNSGTAQGIAIFILDGGALLSAAIIRPWIDKPTNAMNIAICAVNFVNGILLMIFTNIFGGPGLLIGVSGVIFFALNAIFSSVLLIIILLAVGYSLFRKNPDARYPMIADNRASFIKSQTKLTAELDDLAFSARGGDEMTSEKFRSNSNLDLASEDDLPSQRVQHAHLGISHSNDSFRNIPASPISPSLPFTNSVAEKGSLLEGNRSFGHSRVGSIDSNAGSAFVPPSEKSGKGANNVPWQRGAGYDH